MELAAGCRDDEQARAERLVAWGDERWSRRSRWSIFDRLKRREARDGRGKSYEAAARYAIRSIRKVSTATHREVQALIDGLIAISSERRTAAAAAAALPQRRLSAVTPG